MGIVQIPDLDAAYYESHSKSQYKHAKKLIDPLNIDRSASVIDVGCGYGNIIAEISQVASKGKSVGIDASSNMISLAREKFPKGKFPNLDFYHMKAEEMNFSENSFDLVICTNCLLWVRHPRKALDLMCKYLKPEGQLIILTYTADSPYALLLEGVLEKSFPSYKEQSAVKTMLSVKEHKEILTTNGLELETFSLRDRLFKYKHEKEFKEYIKGWLNCYVPLPLKLHESFLNKTIKESFAVNLSSRKNELVIPHQILIVKGRKPRRT